MGESRYEVAIIIVVCMCFGSFRAAADGELDLLLSVKSLISDPLGFLSGWNSTTSSPSFCRWNGVVCVDGASNVARIELPGKNLSGRLSESIFRFPFLESVDLSGNHLSGEIPGDISYCLNLRNLNLSNNNFTGSLPKGSNSTVKLESLDLSNNIISGEIPEDIGFLAGLKVLDVGGNLLTGGIPGSISNLTSLQFLTLASNQLVGEIPSGLKTMKMLQWIYLGYNNLSGGIPTEICELTSLNHLDLVYNNLTGEIPSCLGNLTDLHYLFLYLNKLTGPLPPSIFGLKNLVSLDLSDNFLTGEIPELVIQLQKLEVLHLFSNNLTGKIPTAMASLPRLQVLQLWSNGLTGEIPEELGKRNNLTVLDLSTNNLTGKIPGGLCESGFLFKLILFSNFLDGEMPRSLTRCRSLRRVRLQNNRISGELSSDITRLPLVYYLDISGNRLSGSIGGRDWEMRELQMLNLARNNLIGELPQSFGSKKLEDLDLSNNGFTGVIPSRYGELSELMELKLSNNELSGKIPDELSSCEKLVSLDLSHNKLTGEIPPALSGMPVLGQLDLSMNQLSGEIPDDLGKVESLVEVNVSHNHFHGTLPSTGAFVAINSSAVVGNSLCGGNSATGLPPCKGLIRTNFRWVFLGCLVVVLATIAVAALAFLFVRRRNQRALKRVENEDGTWELQFFDSNASKSITIEDILSCRREGSIIPRGRIGRSSSTNATTDHVKFTVEDVSGEVKHLPTDFWEEAAELGKLRHPNIRKLTAVCKSEKGGFLVYEHAEGKVLGEAIRDMSWERRRRVACGIARGLRYLHCGCSPSFLVGNLSPERVIVDGNDEPRLQLGLSHFMCSDFTKSFVFSFYLPPESRKTKEKTEKTDIYSFGVIIIEMLTGKSPADMAGDIVKWAQYCYSDCHLESWVDPSMKGDALTNQASMVEAMNLAVACTAADPADRPSARDVTKTLDKFGRSGSCGLQFSSNV